MLLLPQVREDFIDSNTNSEKGGGPQDFPLVPLPRRPRGTGGEEPSAADQLLGFLVVVRKGLRRRFGGVLSCNLSCSFFIREACGLKGSNALLSLLLGSMRT